MSYIARLFLVLALSSCAAGPDGVADDAGPPDAAGDFPDAGPDADPDAGPGPDDAGSVDAGTAPDAGGGGSSVAGQCDTDTDCPSGDCTESAPGGFCQACMGDDDACPGGHVCNDFGTCARACTRDDQCPAGLRCNTGAGVCMLRSCQSSATCTGATVCRDGFCRRPACTEACARCEDGTCVD